MTHSDPPLTDDVIEQFLIGKSWWLGQPHTRLAYRIIRKLAKENAKLRAQMAPQGTWVRKLDNQK